MATDLNETPRAQAHHVSDPLVEVDLTMELDALRGNASYQGADHAGRTIAKQPGMRIVLIALKPGGGMHEHRAEAALTVQGVEGTVEFTVGERAVTLTRGRLAAIAAGARHSVKGLDESALLLTIGGTSAPA